MNCVELQQSLAEVDDGSTAEQRAHLRTCPTCAALVKELSLIIATAGDLREADEPSPRVWNNIEAALREEGLIRLSRHRFPSSFGGRWGAFGWLVPAAAMLLLTFGIYFYQQSTRQETVVDRQASALAREASTRVPDVAAPGLNDDDLLQEIADNSPAMKTQFEENLRQVNESIRDAQGWVQESPNDAEARRLLMDAYQQKSMLFELAMDRTLQ
jgi:hypothetical protein